MELGNPSFGCELSPIDFVAFAPACRADGFHCERAEGHRHVNELGVGKRLKTRPC